MIHYDGATRWDGYSDQQGDDAFGNDSQWNDTDGDGFGDNPNGTNADHFPNDPTEWSIAMEMELVTNSDVIDLDGSQDTDSVW